MQNRHIVATTLHTVAIGAVVSWSLTTGAALAQDRLPRDNGIYDYHSGPRYRESESHPLRIAAYILHPIGWVAREVIFRPLSYFASSTPTTRSVMGFREPNDYREPTCFSADDSSPDCRTLSPFNQSGTFNPSNSESAGSNIDRDSSVGDRAQIGFPQVNFDFDSASLNEKGVETSARIAELIKTDPKAQGVSVVVEGHADSVGTEEYNMVLGKKRAEAVKLELVKLGINEQRMKTVSFGEAKPIADGDSPSALATNRRVEVQID